MNYDIKEVFKQFNFPTDINTYGNGHINDTFLVDTDPKCIVQRINSNVFKDPEAVMENIVAVTEHIRKKVEEEGGDTEREVLTVIPTIDGKPFYKATDEDYFRAYKFISGAISYDVVEDPSRFYNVAKAFGKFQKMLSDFPMDKLTETIPRFHDTRDRFNQLKEAIKNDKLGRLSQVKDEVEFALSRENDTDVILDAIHEGLVPIRVTHNDTKLNNIMIDEKTGEGVCVIDLDTVMPGSLLYDFGDALRFGASTAEEDEADLSKVHIDLELFKAFSKGFIEEMKDTFTEKEKELLVFSVKLITFELGMRFLADYLNGDTYFKIHRENHNLDRARNQFALVKDIENNMDTMNKIVKEILEG